MRGAALRAPSRDPRATSVRLWDGSTQLVVSPLFLPPTTTGRARTPKRAQHVKLDYPFQNLGLSLPFLFGSRHCWCLEIWNLQSPRSRGLTVPHRPTLRMEKPRFCRKQAIEALAPDHLRGAKGPMPEARCPQLQHLHSRARAPSIGPRGSAWPRVAHTSPIVGIFFPTWEPATHHLV